MVTNRITTEHRICNRS